MDGCCYLFGGEIVCVLFGRLCFCYVVVYYGCVVNEEVMIWCK